MNSELEYCEVCGERGWVHDDLSHAMGGRWWAYCHCRHGDRLAAEDAEAHRKEQVEFKTCSACNGAGKVKRNG